MGHLVGCAYLLNCCRRITTSNDRGCASFGALGQDLDNRIGPLRKGGPFCNPKGAIKDDGLCVCEGSLESSNGLRANVHNTPTGFNLAAFNDPGVRTGFKAISDYHING